ncbi:hypothetical protein GDO86_016064 [Hymenochirus boettgeri]|uniref:Iodothyronine deiodinase n=1 Tax=Hymenochirus boettgeri TaxID=247094 RepID=A0A8T2JVH5_9PIPI|nr:hypothetical protein GDO86_016064 [Hymenochirus boettgeri]
MLHSAGPHSSKLLKQVAACCLLLPRFLLTALMLWLLDFQCIRRRVLATVREESGSEPEDPPLCVSDSNRMCTVESLRAVWHGQKLDYFKSAHLGCSAPNTEVVVPEGRRPGRILDFSQGKRPLVVNFGTQHIGIADFLLVYIEEAHPSDGWVSTDASYQIPKHQCLQDRLAAAQLMIQEVPGCRVVVDTMDNASNAAYGAYFERLYIILEGKVVYQGGRGPEGYRISELKNWLELYQDGKMGISHVVLQM